MSLQSLPPEIIFSILEHTDKPELINLCFTNKHFSQLVQPRLFRHSSLKSSKATAEYCTLIASRPDLATAVHTLSFNFKEPTSTTPASFWKHFSQSLSCMTNIVSLYLTGVSLDGIFCDVTFPQLKSFDSQARNSFHPDGLAFLGQHPTVTELSLGCDEIPDVPQDFLPFLEFFIGTPFVAEKLVPGRPIKDLVLTWGSLSSEERATDVIQSFSLGSVPINRFSCMTTYLEDTRISLLADIAQYLPSLQTIHLSSPAFTDALDETFIQSLASLLPSFKRLQVLEVPLISPDFDPDDTSVELYENELSVEWKELCPELFHIMFPSCHMYMYDTSSSAWTPTESYPPEPTTLLPHPF